MFALRSKDVLLASAQYRECLAFEGRIGLLVEGLVFLKLFYLIDFQFSYFLRITFKYIFKSDSASQ